MLGHPLSPLGGILNFCSQLEEFSLDLIVFESVNNYGYFLLLKMVFSFVLIEDLNMVVCGLSLLNRFVKWLAIILTCFHSFAVYWFLWLITNTGFDLIFFIFFIALNMWVESSFLISQILTFVFTLQSHFWAFALFHHLNYYFQLLLSLLLS